MEALMLAVGATCTPRGYHVLVLGQNLGAGVRHRWPQRASVEALAGAHAPHRQRQHTTRAEPVFPHDHTTSSELVCPIRRA